MSLCVGGGRRRKSPRINRPMFSRASIKEMDPKSLARLSSIQQKNTSSRRRPLGIAAMLAGDSRHF